MIIGKCVDCVHCEDAPPKGDGSWQGWCIFNPPTPAMIMQNGPPNLVGGPPTQQMTVIAIRPPVTETDSCASFWKRPVVTDKILDAEPIPEKGKSKDHVSGVFP